MKHSVLFTLSLFCWCCAFAQIDSFSINHSKFYVDRPEGWNIVMQKDSAAAPEGLNNLLYRHPAFDECAYSVLGVKFVNRNLRSKASAKSSGRSGKNGVSEVRYVAGFACYYYSNEENTKSKCLTRRYYSGYVHRVNDTLDLIIFMDCAVLEEIESLKMEERLTSLTTTFFSNNSGALISLKPHFDDNIRTDSCMIFGRSLIFPVPYGWVIHERFSDLNNPNGQRVLLHRADQDPNKPIVSIDIGVYQYTQGRAQSTSYIFDYQNMEFIPNPESVTPSRLGSIQEAIASFGYDTTQSQKVYTELFKKTRTTYFTQQYSFIISHKRQFYEISVSLTFPVEDGLQIQYMNEQFLAICKYIRIHNNFKKW